MCLLALSLLVYTYVPEGVMESARSHLRLFAHSTTQVFLLFDCVVTLNRSVVMVLEDGGKTEPKFSR